MNTQFLRKTKIVATVGPACSDQKTLLAMTQAGMNVARLNFSHADHETHEKSLNMVRKINKDHNYNIAILQDLQGPKIRIGNLEKPVKVKKGQVVTLRSDDSTHTDEFIPIFYETLARDVKVGDTILIDDGKVEATVVETNGKNLVKLQIEYGSEIKSRKGVNLPHTNISVPTITEKDYADMDFAIKHRVEWVALSFVRSADDIRLLKELIRLKNGTSKVIAKIEKPEALKNIDAIIEAADAIMIARGDLGVEIPLEEVPSWQKRITRKCILAGRPVIVATQVLESMTTNPRPTRAEANDVANAVTDGADAIMLSGETSIGKFPVKAVEAMTRICIKVEQETEEIYFRNLDVTPPNSEPLSTAIVAAACRLALESDAKAILAMTSSGYTAIQISRCRPKASIFAFTNNRPLLNMLNLVWGVRAFFYDQFISTDDTIQDVQKILTEKQLVEPGDVIINTGSMPLHARGLTNMVKISRVNSEKEKRPK